VENVVAYFYPWDSNIARQALELLDLLLTRSWEVIHSNMMKASSLTLGTLKSLYPKVDLGVDGKSFAATCIEEEANNLVQGFLETVVQILEMILMDLNSSRCSNLAGTLLEHN
jgi:hypothetical protein